MMRLLVGLYGTTRTRGERPGTVCKPSSPARAYVNGIIGHLSSDGHQGV
jgi:hypothetical protein